MLRRAPLLLALLVVLWGAPGCSEPEPPVTVGEGMVTVVNQTGHDWTGVLITVNDHFRGYVPSLKSQGRANAPLSQFTTGHGQRWTGALVRTIDVTAKSADGTDVTLTWGRQTPEKP